MQNLKILFRKENSFGKLSVATNPYFFWRLIDLFYLNLSKFSHSGDILKKPYTASDSLMARYSNLDHNITVLLYILKQSTTKGIQENFKDKIVL